MIKKQVFFYEGLEVTNIVGYPSNVDAAYPDRVRNLNGGHGAKEILGSRVYDFVVVAGRPGEADLVVSELAAVAVRDDGPYAGREKPIVCVVENGTSGLVSRLASAYADTGLRFAVAKKFGDIVDLGLAGQTSNPSSEGRNLEEGL